MHLIFTHEQADFDAAASQLAAYKLNPAAVPVLSRRTNRNVRAFLILYGGELPFVEAEDWPAMFARHKAESGGLVERVTLVDTQSITTVKGMADPANLTVHIIDHHPLSRDLPETWTAAIEETGATVTILIEALRNRETALSQSEATLLLLGIYEDTGSLSYLTTTSRDLLAAAWLLERGASLKIANDFLNHPLTDDQRALYDQLMAAAETLSLNGQTVIVATADTGGMVEEISSVAHKLRDALEPDALFLLVRLESHVQLVARSTGDAIDVSTIASAFGGGGHDRAAAAAIRDLSLEAARAKLLALLPSQTRPAATVAQIMSQGAHILTPQTTVAQAAQVIQRYGHEGYPVVQTDGEGQHIVGLLTRRAVDRALSHQMSATPISTVMDAGQVSVSPADSIEHLQRVMTTHGWGQVPVVSDSGDGRVIGIVTRTDLIKRLPDDPISGPRNVADLLESRLPPTRLALLQQIGEAASDMHMSAYIVGGFVRDLLLNIPVADFDLVVEGDAIALARSLARRHGGRVRGHSRFGTAKWLLSDDRHLPTSDDNDRPSAVGGQRSAGDALPPALDFVSARIEFYAHPTALPEVERGSIKLDLHRRDFTINTLAIRLDAGHFGNLLDFWGGERDLHDGLVRVLHSISFVDDPTRILRAVRLEQRLGFQLEPRTEELVEHALPLLDRVSGDRVRRELDFILAEAEPPKPLRRLAALGVLPHIHPALAWDNWLEQKFSQLIAALPGPDRYATTNLFYGLWVYRLTEPELFSLAARLKFTRALFNHLHQVIQLRDRLPDLARAERPSQLVSLLENYDEQALQTLQIAADDPAARTAMTDYLERLRWIAPTTDGAALKARGLKPGPTFGRILRALRDARLDGQITNDQSEQSLLDQLISEAAAT